MKEIADIKEDRRPSETHFDTCSLTFSNRQFLSLFSSFLFPAAVIIVDTRRQPTLFFPTFTL
jgi:hypothetical protein